MSKKTFHQSIPFVYLTEDVALSPLEFCECDNYVLVYPYGYTNAPLEVLENKGTYSVTIDRDEYITEDIEVVYRICEIYFDSEDVTNVREYLNSKEK
jgi:hypothetical protein